MNTYKVYYCFMIEGVWEHWTIVKADTCGEARLKVARSLGLRNVSMLDYINATPIK